MNFDYPILIIGIFFTCVTFVFAKRKGRNAILWGFIAAASFLGMLLLVLGGINFIIGFVEGPWRSEEVSDNYQIHIYAVALLVCTVTNSIILLYVSKVQDKPSSEPPLPPIFE
jgi:hypothetical protein